MYVLAHLTDPHLPLPPTRLRELASKRVIGFFNWQRRRRRDHRLEVLDALVADLHAAQPNHIAVTGDLVNIALRGEFAPALEFLAKVGSPANVTFVPGNHDTYVRTTLEHAYRYWGAYMRGDDAPVVPESRFPFVQRRGPIAVIGLSTAIPTAPFLATGKLGREQLARLAPMLERLGAEGAFRVVLLHHPPTSAVGGRLKRLIDARAFREVIRQQGAELILHGHSHINSQVMLDGPAGKIPAIGVPSASASPTEGHEPASYNLYRIEQQTTGWRCECVSRGFAIGREGVAELGRKMLIG